MVPSSLNSMTACDRSIALACASARLTAALRCELNMIPHTPDLAVGAASIEIRPSDRNGCGIALKMYLNNISRENTGAGGGGRRIAHCRPGNFGGHMHVEIHRYGVAANP